jgi:hypothetical protein
MTVIPFSGHQWHRCTRERCIICEGGLGCCTVCGGAEGSLPTECPGELMPPHVQDAVYDEQIDFSRGRWRLGCRRPTRRGLRMVPA